MFGAATSDEAISKPEQQPTRPACTLLRAPPNTKHAQKVLSIMNYGMAVSRQGGCQFLKAECASRMALAPCLRDVIGSGAGAAGAVGAGNGVPIILVS